MSHTPEQALAEARRLYEERKPIGWRTFHLGGIKVANRVNLVADMRQTFRSLCRVARGAAERIHESDHADLARRLAIFGLTGRK